MHHVATTGSTNTDLADAARAGDVDPIVLVADHQHAGRGRLDRIWDDDPGRSLLVSMRLRADAEAAPRLVQAVGAATRAAAARFCPVPVRMKWPNDLVVTDGAAPGKLAGLLAEYVDGSQPVVVIGVGVNLDRMDRQPAATSLRECGGRADRDGLLAALLEELARRTDPDEVLAELRAHSATLGTRVRVERPSGDDLVGSAIDLHPDGRLIVRDDGGVDITVGSGDVVHLRDA